MGKEIMRQEKFGTIPIWIWKKNPLISIGEGRFVNLEPIGKNIRTLEIAERMANRFAEMYNCTAKVTNEVDWERAIQMLGDEKNKFIEKHNLGFCEVLLKDTIGIISKHALAGGLSHEVDEIFYGFISAFDADGEEQPSKLVFVTLEFDDSKIEYVS